MAYSPSPQPGALPHTATYSNLNRHSVTPPLPQLSKRDKRRNALSERLNDISASFAQNRDAQYRSQLQGLQLVMNFINSSEPYKNSPLNDNPEDIYDELNAAVADNAQRVAQTGSRSAVTEVPLGTQRSAASYVKEINDEMETRDANLTVVANKYNDAIDAMSRDVEFQVDVACKEHEQLVSAVRDRIYSAVQRKRQKLVAERETLDIADNTAALFHLNHSITHPASPGGPQSNRKTRHGRHLRDNLDPIGGVSEINNRKRKVPADTENGSPSRALDSDTNFPWKELNAKLEVDNTPPTLALDQLFTEKELLFNIQKASRFAVHNMSTKYRNTSSRTSKDVRSLKGKKRAYVNGNASSVPQSLSSSDTEDPTPPHPNILLPIDLPTSTEDALLLLEAPLMDRTANSSYHATRSTATIPTTSSYDADILEPGEVIGRRSAINLLGTEKTARKREDEYQRAPGLNDIERDNDLTAMALAMEQMRNGGGGKAGKKTRDTLLKHAIREKIDHMATAEALSQESSLRETLSNHS